MNDDGQCGTGDELNVPLPTKIEFKNDTKAQYVVDISCGHSHTGEFMALMLSLSITEPSQPPFFFQYVCCQTSLRFNGQITSNDCVNDHLQ